MKISQNGIRQLTSHEGLRLKAYDDKQPNKNITSETQVLGTLTIGYGHTKRVYPQMTITEQKAVELLRIDLDYFEKIVTKKVKVDLNQNQFDALVSFCFNVGEGNFGSSTLLKKLNANDYVGASEQFLVWNKPASILGRREDEKALFMQDYGVLPFINPSAKNVGNEIVAIGIGALLLLV